MTAVDPLILAFEQALDAHALALNSTDPAELERCNAGLAALVRQLRGRLSAADPGPALPWQRLRSRLVAQSAMVMRASSGNRAALTVLGLTVGQDALAATPAPRHRGTQLIA